MDDRIRLPVFNINRQVAEAEDHLENLEINGKIKGKGKGKVSPLQALVRPRGFVEV